MTINEHLECSKFLAAKLHDCCLKNELSEDNSYNALPCDESTGLVLSKSNEYGETIVHEYENYKESLGSVFRDGSSIGELGDSDKSSVPAEFTLNERGESSELLVKEYVVSTNSSLEKNETCWESIVGVYVDKEESTINELHDGENSAAKNHAEELRNSAVHNLSDYRKLSLSDRNDCTVLAVNNEHEFKEITGNENNNWRKLVINEHIDGEAIACERNVNKHVDKEVITNEYNVNEHTDEETIASKENVYAQVDNETTTNEHTVNELFGKETASNEYERIDEEAVTNKHIVNELVDKKTTTSEHIVDEETNVNEAELVNKQMLSSERSSCREKVIEKHVDQMEPVRTDHYDDFEILDSQGLHLFIEHCEKPEDNSLSPIGDKTLVFSHIGYLNVAEKSMQADRCLPDNQRNKPSHIHIAKVTVCERNEFDESAANDNDNNKYLVINKHDTFVATNKYNDCGKSAFCKPTGHDVLAITGLDDSKDLVIGNPRDSVIDDCRDSVMDKHRLLSTQPELECNEYSVLNNFYQIHASKALHLFIENSEQPAVNVKDDCNEISNTHELLVDEDNTVLVLNTEILVNEDNIGQESSNHEPLVDEGNTVLVSNTEEVFVDEGNTGHESSNHEPLVDEDNTVLVSNTRELVNEGNIGHESSTHESLVDEDNTVLVSNTEEVLDEDNTVLVSNTEEVLDESNTVLVSNAEEVLDEGNTVLVSNAKEVLDEGNTVLVSNTKEVLDEGNTVLVSNTEEVLAEDNTVLASSTEEVLDESNTVLVLNTEAVLDEDYTVLVSNTEEELDEGNTVLVSSTEELVDSNIGHESSTHDPQVDEGNAVLVSNTKEIFVYEGNTGHESITHEPLINESNIVCLSNIEEVLVDEDNTDHESSTHDLLDDEGNTALVPNTLELPANDNHVDVVDAHLSDIGELIINNHHRHIQAPYDDIQIPGSQTLDLFIESDTQVSVSQALCSDIQILKIPSNDIQVSNTQILCDDIQVSTCQTLFNDIQMLTSQTLGDDIQISNSQTLCDDIQISTNQALCNDIQILTSQTLSDNSQLSTSQTLYDDVQISSSQTLVDDIQISTSQALCDEIQIPASQALNLYMESSEKPVSTSEDNGISVSSIEDEALVLTRIDYLSVTEQNITVTQIPLTSVEDGIINKMHESVQLSKDVPFVDQQMNVQEKPISPFELCEKAANFVAANEISCVQKCVLKTPKVVIQVPRVISQDYANFVLGNVAKESISADIATITNVVKDDVESNNNLINVLVDNSNKPFLSTFQDNTKSGDKLQQVPYSLIQFYENDENRFAKISTESRTGSTSEYESINERLFRGEDGQCCMNASEGLELSKLQKKDTINNVNMSERSKPEEVFVKKDSIEASTSSVLINIEKLLATENQADSLASSNLNSKKLFVTKDHTEMISTDRESVSEELFTADDHTEVLTFLKSNSEELCVAKDHTEMIPTVHEAISGKLSAVDDHTEVLTFQKSNSQELCVPNDHTVIFPAEESVTEDQLVIEDLIETHIDAHSVKLLVTEGRKEILTAQDQTEIFTVPESNTEGLLVTQNHSEILAACKSITEELHVTGDHSQIATAHGSNSEELVFVNKNYTKMASACDLSALVEIEKQLCTNEDHTALNYEDNIKMVTALNTEDHTKPDANRNLNLQSNFNLEPSVTKQLHSQLSQPSYVIKDSFIDTCKSTISNQSSNTQACVIKDSAISNQISDIQACVKKDSCKDTCYLSIGEQDDFPNRFVIKDCCISICNSNVANGNNDQFAINCVNDNSNDDIASTQDLSLIISSSQEINVLQLPSDKVQLSSSKTSELESAIYHNSYHQGTCNNDTTRLAYDNETEIVVCNNEINIATCNKTEIATCNNKTQIATSNNEAEIVACNNETKLVTCNNATEIAACNNATELATSNNKTKIITCNNKTEIVTCNSETEITTCNNEIEKGACNNETEIATCNETEIATCNNKTEIITCNNETKVVTCYNETEIVTCLCETEIVTCNKDNKLATCNYETEVATCYYENEIVTCKNETELVACNDKTETISCNYKNNGLVCNNETEELIIFSNEADGLLCNNESKIVLCENDIVVGTSKIFNETNDDSQLLERPCKPLSSTPLKLRCNILSDQASENGDISSLSRESSLNVTNIVINKEISLNKCNLSLGFTETFVNSASDSEICKLPISPDQTFDNTCVISINGMNNAYESRDSRLRSVTYNFESTLPTSDKNKLHKVVNQQSEIILTNTGSLFAEGKQVQSNYSQYKPDNRYSVELGEVSNQYLPDDSNSLELKDYSTEGFNKFTRSLKRKKEDDYLNNDVAKKIACDQTCLNLSTNHQSSQNAFNKDCCIIGYSDSQVSLNKSGLIAGIVGGIETASQISSLRANELNDAKIDSTIDHQFSDAEDDSEDEENLPFSQQNLKYHYGFAKNDTFNSFPKSIVSTKPLASKPIRPGFIASPKQTSQLNQQLISACISDSKFQSVKRKNTEDFEINLELKRKTIENQLTTKQLFESLPSPKFSGEGSLSSVQTPLVTSCEVDKYEVMSLITCTANCSAKANVNADIDKNTDTNNAISVSVCLKNTSSSVNDSTITVNTDELGAEERATSADNYEIEIKEHKNAIIDCNSSSKTFSHINNIVEMRNLVEKTKASDFSQSGASENSVEFFKNSDCALNAVPESPTGVMLKIDYAKIISCNHDTEPTNFATDNRPSLYTNDSDLNSFEDANKTKFSGQHSPKANYLSQMNESVSNSEQSSLSEYPHVKSALSVYPHASSLSPVYPLAEDYIKSSILNYKLTMHVYDSVNISNESVVRNTIASDCDVKISNERATIVTDCDINILNESAVKNIIVTDYDVNISNETNVRNVSATDNDELIAESCEPESDISQASNASRNKVMRCASCSSIDNDKVTELNKNSETEYSASKITMGYSDNVVEGIIKDTARCITCEKICCENNKISTECNTDEVSGCNKTLSADNVNETTAFSSPNYNNSVAKSNINVNVGVECNASETITDNIDCAKDQINYCSKSRSDTESMLAIIGCVESTSLIADKCNAIENVDLSGDVRYTIENTTSKYCTLENNNLTAENGTIVNNLTIDICNTAENMCLVADKCNTAENNCLAACECNTTENSSLMTDKCRSIQNSDVAADKYNMLEYDKLAVDECSNIEINCSTADKHSPVESDSLSADKCRYLRDSVSPVFILPIHQELTKTNRIEFVSCSDDEDEFECPPLNLACLDSSYNFNRTENCSNQNISSASLFNFQSIIALGQPKTTQDLSNSISDQPRTTQDLSNSIPDQSRTTQNLSTTISDQLQDDVNFKKIDSGSHNDANTVNVNQVNINPVNVNPMNVNQGIQEAPGSCPLKVGVIIPASEISIPPIAAGEKENNPVSSSDSYDLKTVNQIGVKSKRNSLIPKKIDCTRKKTVTGVDELYASALVDISKSLSNLPNSGTALTISAVSEISTTICNIGTLKELANNGKITADASSNNTNRAEKVASADTVGDENCKSSSEFRKTCNDVSEKMVDEYNATNVLEIFSNADNEPARTMATVENCLVEDAPKTNEKLTPKKLSFSKKRFANASGLSDDAITLKKSRAISETSSIEKETILVAGNNEKDAQKMLSACSISKLFEELCSECTSENNGNAPSLTSHMLPLEVFMPDQTRIAKNDIVENDAAVGRLNTDFMTTAVEVEPNITVHSSEESKICANSTMRTNVNVNVCVKSNISVDSAVNTNTIAHSAEETKFAANSGMETNVFVSSDMETNSNVSSGMETEISIWKSKLSINSDLETSTSASNGVETNISVTEGAVINFSGETNISIINTGETNSCLSNADEPRQNLLENFALNSESSVPRNKNIVVIMPNADSCSSGMSAITCAHTTVEIV